MNRKTALRVSELVGWKMDPDGKTVVLGFRRPSGAELNVAMDEGVLAGMILDLLAAWGGFDIVRGGEGQLAAGKSSRLEIRCVRESRNYVLTAWFAGGGRFSFELPESAGQALRDAVSHGEAVLGGSGAKGDEFH